MEFYGRYTYEHGECLEEETLDAITYLMEYDKDFAEERNYLEKADIQKIKKEFQEHISINYYQNEEIFINRLEKKDLPLFLEHDGFNSDSRLLIERRLKEA